jgi:hypothetical protein
MWVHDRDAIEIGLRLAQQKFGPTLTLTGPEEFKMATAHAGSGAFRRHRARRIFGTRMIMPIAARALRQTVVVSVVLFKS